jgi:hypothetical protein
VNSVTADPTAPASSPNRADEIEKIWVPTVGQNAVITEMKKLLEAPSSTRPTNLALMAAPNYGKSQMLIHFEDLTNPPYEETAETTNVHVIRIDLTHVREPVAVLRECLSALYVRFHTKDPPDELWRRLKIHIQPLNIKLFLLDDVNSIAALTVTKQKEFLQLFRAFGNKTGRPIVLAGTDLVKTILEHDPQFDTRFLRMSLPPIASDRETQRLLKGFEERWRPGRTTKLVAPETVKLVVQMVGREPGALFRLLKQVAIAADEAGQETVSPESLKEAARRVPGIAPDLT